LKESVTPYYWADFFKSLNISTEYVIGCSGARPFQCIPFTTLPECSASFQQKQFSTFHHSPEAFTQQLKSYGVPNKAIQGAASFCVAIA
jgi:hypothetical protein